jgi:integrase/recombinase XerD
MNTTYRPNRAPHADTTYVSPEHAYADAGANTPALLGQTSDALGHLADTWKRAAIGYLVEVRLRTGSTRTPTEYGRYLARFLAAVDPPTITPAQVFTFIHAIGPSGREPSASSIAVRLAAVRGFLDFARRMGLISSNPAIDVKTPKPAAPTPRGLNAQELLRLLEAVPSTPGGLRDRAIIITSVLTGLRRAEVLGLKAGDLAHDSAAGILTYRARAKGGYERHRELPAPALQAIRASVASRGQSLAELAPDTLLFPITAAGFYANLRRYAAKAELAHVTPHTLRHSAAKLRRETGSSIEDVGALLGHQSLYTTARYLARLEGTRDPGWHGVAALLGV